MPSVFAHRDDRRRLWRWNESEVEDTDVSETRKNNPWNFQPIYVSAIYYLCFYFLFIFFFVNRKLTVLLLLLYRRVLCVKQCNYLVACYTLMMRRKRTSCSGVCRDVFWTARATDGNRSAVKTTGIREITWHLSFDAITLPWRSKFHCGRKFRPDRVVRGEKK